MHFSSVFIFVFILFLFSCCAVKKQTLETVVDGNKFMRCVSLIVSCINKKHFPNDTNQKWRVCLLFALYS